MLDLPVAQAVVWEWLNDPGQALTLGRRPDGRGRAGGRGRTGPGAVYHCHHGSGVVDHTIVDWRPFASFSEEVRPRRRTRALLTWRLDAVGRGHAASSRRRPERTAAGAVRRRLCRVYAERELSRDLAALEQAILGTRV